MIKLIIITPTELIVNVFCQSVTLPGVSGELQILPNHSSIITILKPGRIIYDNMQLDITSGYAEIHNNVLSVICKEQPM